MKSILFLPLSPAPRESHGRCLMRENVCPAICQPARHCQKLSYVHWSVWNVKLCPIYIMRREPYKMTTGSCYPLLELLNSSEYNNVRWWEGEGEGKFFSKPGESLSILKLILRKDITAYIKHEMPYRKTSNIAVALQRQMVQHRQDAILLRHLVAYSPSLNNRVGLKSTKNKGNSDCLLPRLEGTSCFF